MPLDIGWIVSLSLATVISTLSILAIINLLVRRSEYKDNHVKANGSVV